MQLQRDGLKIMSSPNPDRTLILETISIFMQTYEDVTLAVPPRQDVSGFPTLGVSIT